MFCNPVYDALWVHSEWGQAEVHFLPVNRQHHLLKGCPSSTEMVLHLCQKPAEDIRTDLFKK